MARVRGASIRGTIDFIRKGYGEEAVTRVLGALAPATRAAINDGGPAVIVNGWYDCAALTEMSEQMDRLLGQGDLSLVRAAGRHVAFEDVNRFFRWLLRLAGPATVFNRAASVWNNYHDTGQYVAEEVGAGQAVIRIDGWEAAGAVMCKRVEGWIERALELTLGPTVAPTIHETQHLARDPAVTPHPFCRFTARWSDG